MISIFIDNKKLAIKLNNCSPTAFNEALLSLKHHRFFYNSKSNCWEGSLFKYDEIKEELSDTDIIEDFIDKNTLIDTLAGNPEQERSSIRRIPDYSIMNFGPMQGKHPYENFQNLGITQGINKSRYAYFWQMGTGKSYVAAAIIAHRLYKYHDVNKVVFMTTNIGVRNLRYELLKFIKGLDESKVKIADKNYRNPFDDKNTDIVITSYNSFRLICDYYKKQKKIKSATPRKPFLPIKEWADGKDVMLVLDESHEIMNPSSQRGHLVALHSELFRYRYLFTGTPADNPEKLYNQFKTLDPWLVYNLSFSEWKEKMAVLGDKFSPFAIREWKKDELEESNKRFLKAHGNYYETTDLLDLPDYNEKKIYLTMQPIHRDIYERLVLSDIENRKGSDIVNRFPYMMLAVDNPFLLEKHKDKFDKELISQIDHFKISNMEKMSAIEDIIGDHPDEKILIWAIHPLTIQMIGDKFKKYNPICITGETPQEERNDLVETFKHDPNHKLLIANITTLNTSATITEATVQIYVERGFSYSPYYQSTRRIYRIGQEKDVTSYILIYDNSLDTLVDKNLSSKGILVKGLVKKDFITQAEWVKIFNSSSLENDEF